MANIRAEIYRLAATIYSGERPNFPQTLKFLGKLTVSLSVIAEAGLIAAGVDDGTTLALPLCAAEVGAGMWFIGHAGTEKPDHLR